MAFHDFLNKSIVIQRMKTSSGYKRTFVSTGTVDAHIQKITDEATFQLFGALQATHKGWTDIANDVQEGDRIRDPDGREYFVVATNKQDYGMNVHLELILKHNDA